MLWPRSQRDNSTAPAHGYMADPNPQEMTLRGVMKATFGIRCDVAELLGGYEVPARDVGASASTRLTAP